MNCQSCGNTNPPVANFCLGCGQLLKSNPSRVNMQSLEAAPYGLPTRGVSLTTPKPKRNPPSWKRIAVTSSLAIGIGLGLAGLYYLQWNHNATKLDRQAQSMALAEQTVKRGLLLTKIEPSSPAAISGLRPGDIVVRYGGSVVEDITSYVDGAVAQSPGQQVPITVFRNGKEINLTVPAGYLGFKYEDWNPARKQIYERLAAHDKKGAAQLAEEAERDESLTDVQALIVKIILIPIRSSKEREQERSELLAKLMSRYPMIHICRLATDEFFSFGSYAAAARCYEEQLARFDKEDVNVRLNLALAYARLYEYDRAEYNVRYIVDRPNPGLSPYGVLVAHEVSGDVAAGRNRYREALAHFLPYLDRGDENTVMMCLLSAAKLGDLEKFNAIRDRAITEAADKVKRRQFEVDTLNAYVLSEHGKKEEAAALVLKWGTPHCIVETAAWYWDATPGGNGIAERMRSLVEG